jgi:hypothetical protein
VNFGFNAGHGKSPSRITKRRMTTPQPGHSAGSDLRLAATPKPSYAERPKLSDPAHGTSELQTTASRRVRCSAWLGRWCLMLCDAVAPS